MNAPNSRFAAYLRISTTDKQDASLSFPSQEEGCRKRVAELGGEVVCRFTDEESGAHDDRPGWSALVAEARDREGRRFDGVVCYATSRLSRDRVSAGLFERELRKLGVSVVYAMGAGDPSTAEGMLLISLQQSFDEYERSKLRRETRRGLLANAEQGFRNGGRAPFGYQLAKEPHPNPARARAGETKSRLVPDPEQAAVVREIYHLYAVKELGVRAIANHLNGAGIPSPMATNPRLNTRNAWGVSTLHSILRNPTYTGRAVWDRLNTAQRRELGSSVAKVRPQDEWIVVERAHEPVVSDEVFAAAQARLASKRKGTGRPRGKTTRVHLLAGMVRCATGHQPLSTSANVAKGHVYYRCQYARDYGREAAEQIEGHGLNCGIREEVLVSFIERFLAERVFGPMRTDLLAKQFDQADRQATKSARRERTTLQRKLDELQRAIKAQVRGLEAGVDAELVQERIAELRAEQAEAEAALAACGPAEDDSEGRSAVAAALAKVPDLSDVLRSAPPETKRRVYDALDLRVVHDKARKHLQITATVEPETAALLATDPRPDGLDDESLRGWDSNPQPFG